MKLSIKKSSKRSVYFERLFYGTIIFLFSFVILSSIPNTAHAGLLSFINNVLVLGSEQVSAKDIPRTTANSQTMALLPQPAVNIDPNPDKLIEVVPVIDGGTLVPDIASSNLVDYSSKISVYVVHDGDTISSIAKMFNVSINTVLWANNLNSKSLLNPGQTLVILPVTGIKYVVQKNDTVSSIAKKYKADMDEIYSYNDINNSTGLTLGQTIIIPDAEIGVPVSTTIVRSVSGLIVPEDPLTVDVGKLPSYPGFYSCPVVGRLSQGLHGRNSVDLAAPIGTPLRASADGIVMISKSNGTWNGGYGNYVVISHSNGTQTLYGHMLRTIVGPGEHVLKGQTIGYIGISGMTTGPHVHFEVRGAMNPFATISCN